MKKLSFFRIFVAVVLVAFILNLASWKGYAYQGVPVFMYHSITDNQANPYCISPRQFLLQMNTLNQEGYKTLTASELLNDWTRSIPVPPKSVVLTFDDGYEDNYKNAFPTLKKYHLKATIFLATGLIGKKNYLTWNEIKEMYRSGLIDFESHTVHHPNLLKLSAQQQFAEFQQSKQAIESQLHNHVAVFAYPFGYHNRAMIPRLQKSGYLMAYDSDLGVARYSQGIYSLDRIEVSKEKSFSRLLAGDFR